MFKTKANVLIVDDEREIGELLYDELSIEGYLCRTVLNGKDAIAKLKSESYGVVLLDIRLPDISGMEILSTINSSRYDTMAIMMTGIDSLALAVEAMKCGAADYIVKPFSIAKISESIQNILERKRLSLRKGDGRIPDPLDQHKDGDSPLKESYKELDAIADGVQARYDLVIGHSKIITEETAEIARQLGLPDDVIQRWVQERSRIDFEKRMSIKRSLDKLEQSQPVQEMMGLMRPYQYVPINTKADN